MALSHQKPAEPATILYATEFGYLPITHPGTPPCVMCGNPVHTPSMNGPGVCIHCDLGVHPDGTQWTLPETLQRGKDARTRIERWVAQGL